MRHRTCTLLLTAVAPLAIVTAGAQSAGEHLVAEAERLAVPSNAERIAALEATLDRRGLPYEAHAFTGSGDPDDPRPVGRNLVLTFGTRVPELIVGAHADAARLDDGSLSRGVVDNASGVVALLELAETLRDDPPARRVRVVFFDMEEVGLRGSAAFAATLDPAAVAAMVNVDIVGYGDAVYFGPDGSDREASPDARRDAPTLAQRVQQVCVDQAMVCVGTPRMPPSDDRSFIAAGIPAVSIALLPATEAAQPLAPLQRWPGKRPARIPCTGDPADHPYRARHGRPPAAGRPGARRSVRHRSRARSGRRAAVTRRRWGSGEEAAVRQLIERGPEPDGERLRVRRDPGADIRGRLPLPAVHFRRIGRRVAGMPADQDMVVLVFHQPVIQVGAVDEAERRLEGAVEAHLFLQPAVRGVERRFTWPRMAAARVRPEAAGVVLRLRPPLQQQPAGVVEDEDGKRAV